MAFLRQLFWLVVFVVATLCFMVLFENGPKGFVPNITKRVHQIQQYFMEMPKGTNDAKASPSPTPEATPAESMTPAS